MGFDVDTFEYILSSGFSVIWYTTTILCLDTNSISDPWPNWHSLDAAGALGLVLHYLNSTMHEISLQQIFAIISPTPSRYIKFGLYMLLATLKTVPEAWITWPQAAEFEELSRLVQQCHPHLHGAFGSIDGLKVPIETSNDDEIEYATFNRWLSEHFVSLVIAFFSQGRSPACLLCWIYSLTSSWRCHHCSKNKCTWKLAWFVCCTTHLPQAVDKNTRQLLHHCWHCIPAG